MASDYTTCELTTVDRLIGAEKLVNADPRLQDFVRVLLAQLPYRFRIVYADRSRSKQLELYAQGRKQNPDGTWEIVDKELIVTKALPDEAPHCRTPSGALDIMPLTDGGHVVWDQKDPRWKWILIRLQEMAHLARAVGLHWGGDWISIKDYDHFEVEDWRSLPMSTQ